MHRVVAQIQPGTAQLVHTNSPFKINLSALKYKRVFVVFLWPESPPSNDYTQL